MTPNKGLISWGGGVALGGGGLDSHDNLGWEFGGVK